AMKNPTVTTTFLTRTRESIEAFVAFVEETKAHLHTGQNLSLQIWADQFLDETGYVAELRRSEKTPEASENRVRNLKELVATLDATPGTPTPDPAERLNTFLEELTLDSSREEDKEAKG